MSHHRTDYLKSLPWIIRAWLRGKRGDSTEQGNMHRGVWAIISVLVAPESAI